MRHIRINIGLFALLSGLICTSCSEEAAVEHSFGESVPLSVNSLHIDGELATRAGGTPVTAEGAAIKVFLTNMGGYTPVYNRTYTYSGGKWSSVSPVCVDKRTGKAVAVYDPNGLVDFGLNSAVTTNALQAQPFSEGQLWYYDNVNGTGVNSTTPAAFSMKCAYARLSFSISRNVSYPSACKVSQIVIKPSSGDFYTIAQVNITDGSLTGTAVASYAINTSALSMNTTGLVVGIPDTDIDYLFPAQTLASGAGLTFTLTTDGKDYTVTVPAATFNKIQAGVHYTVQLEMTGIGIVVNSVTTTDWITSGSNIDSKFD